MTGVDLKKHFSLESSTDVSEIVNSVLKHVGANYFNYVKIYEDGSRALLSNNAPWIQHFYENALYNAAGIIDVEYLLPKGYFLWSDLEDNDGTVYNQSREYFNIDNGLTFITKQENATVVYIIGSTRKNYKINGFYIRNLDLFKRFILYFNDKGHNLIKKADEQKIYLPQKQIIQDSPIQNFHIDSEQRQSFLNATDIKKYYLPSLPEGKYLTKNEAICCAYLLQGLTAKQIAKKTELSFRTIEAYLAKIKLKLGVQDKAELIEKLSKDNLIDIIYNK